MFDPISAIIGFLSGGTCGSIITWIATSRREKSGRLRVFKAFMVQLRSEAADRFHAEGTFATFYQNKIPNLRHAAAGVADDFTAERRAEFERLISTAAGFTGEQADRNKQQILEAIDAITKFTDT